MDAEEAERDLCAVLDRRDERDEAVVRLPDRVRPAEQNHVVGVEAGERGGKGRRRRLRVREHDARAERARVLDDVFLLGARDHAELGAACGEHALEHVIHDGLPCGRQELLRPLERLEPGRVPRGGDDPDERHRQRGTAVSSTASCGAFPVTAPR